MRSTLFVVALVVWAGLGLASIGAAQTAVTATGVEFAPAGPAAIGLAIRAAQRPPGGTPQPAYTEDSCLTRIGVFALWSSTGCYNTASGNRALFLNTTGNYNTASGHEALRFNTTGYANTASGAWALYSNTTGFQNTASGMDALLSNTTGYLNAASGYQALRTNTTGFLNTASGNAALYSNTAGIANTASGVYGLYSNTTGNYNTVGGAQGLYSNTSGFYNTASGIAALFFNTTGSRNTASGEEALYSNTTGQFNAALGGKAGYNATTGSYNVFLGADVVGTGADTNTIRIGLPFNGGTGQNQTFIAGIRDTQLAGSAVQVFIDANGQLGTLVPTGGTPGLLPMAATSRALGDALDRLIAVTQQVHDQQATIADLRARLDCLEALAAAAEHR